MKICPLCHQEYSEDIKLCNCGFDFVTAQILDEAEALRYKPKFFFYGAGFNLICGILSYYLTKQLFIAIFKPFMDRQHFGMVFSIYDEQAAIPPPPGYELIALYFIIVGLFALFISVINNYFLKRIHKNKKSLFTYLQIGTILIFYCLTALINYYLF